MRFSFIARRSNFFDLALRFSISLVAVLFIDLWMSNVAQAQSRLASPVRNLRVSNFLGPDVDGKIAAFVVSEYQEGGTDLNGDGDIDDYVLHVFDIASQETINLEYASTAFDVDGSLLAFLVSENSQDETDLNGDGDAFDQVAFVYDAGSGEVTNLGISSGFETIGPVVKGNLVAVTVSEFAQGNTDLNNDGDADDMQILHVHDVMSGVTRNLELATSFFSPSNGGLLIAFPVLEFEQAHSDLNGDGDASDFVLHVYDSVTDAVLNTGVATDSISPSVINHLVAFEVFEDQADLNNDGDMSDKVAHVFNAMTGELRNLGLANEGNGPRITGKDIVIVSVDEDSQNSDLNGDGDLLDRVDHVHSYLANSTTNLGLSSAGYVASGDLIAVRVWESGQGFSDLNGDGDTSDEVLHFHNARTGETTNLQIQSEFDVQFDGPILAFRVSEDKHYSSDLNGDNDTSDTVVHTYHAGTGEISNSEIATQANSIQINRLRIALKVDELSQASTDLNGDGDASDKVLHVLDTRTDSVRNVRRAVDNFRFSSGVIAFDVPEASQGASDLNQDKDVQDRVMHVMTRL